MRRKFLSVICVVSLMSVRVSLADEIADATFFESKVRPLLIAKCLECHSSDKPKAGLQLDSREAVLKGGESGPAAIEGKPEDSLIIDAIGYRNTVQMPPKSKLPDAEIAILTEWVKRGLPWPNSKPTVPTSAPVATVPTDYTDEQKSFWAFQPVKRALPPDVQSDAWARSPIDRFVLAELENKKLNVAREAQPRTLFRRVTLDLIGLPPTPDEVNEFVNDQSPDALERAVDRLLASAAYGERWARHWLDVARYADSNGLDENLAYANAYRYRDYVVKAMRDDKPYDRFLTEQIAGDLLVDHADELLLKYGPVSDSYDELVATGFLCLGAKMLAEDDPVKMQMDIIDEQVDTIARAVMGLTMGCARCHDHKFDPLSTEDYYGLAGVFKSTQTMDTFTVVAKWHERPLASPGQVRERDELQKIANAKNDEIEKLKKKSTEAILNDARANAAAYLLAAAHELRTAERLKVAIPRGSMGNPQEIPGAILIEAEDFARGNVLKDRDNYGAGIGVLVNKGETPNAVEYDIEIPQNGVYQLELRYAAAAIRPVKVSVNSRQIKPDAANQFTGSWTPDSQKWFVECYVRLNAGKNLLRLEQSKAFPHIDKLLLVPADPNDVGGLASVTTDADVKPPLLPSLVQQWVKALGSSKADPGSILTGWHQYESARQLTVDSTLPENAVARLLGDTQPASLDELATRYEKLFADARQAWKELKAPPEGKEAKSLNDPVLEAARKLLKDDKGPFAPPTDIESSYPESVVAELKEMRDEKSRLEAAVPKYPETMAVLDSKPENLKVHLRGSHLTLGREVTRRLPKILVGSEPQELKQGSGRLELVEWLTDPRHPLTARVMVNRIWQWHFGHGIVRSPDNFGRLGERPSHPELLDWLANRFTGNGEGRAQDPRAYSLKHLHRMLIATSAYRQSTEANPAADTIDPENRLLWRFNRQRMDVEVLRDSLLAMSGQLDDTPKGTLLPTANRAYVTSTASVNPAIYNSPRRSIYLPVVRSALYEVFTAFDFADPSTLAGQRDQTTVAPQALFMMNSALVLEQVQAITRSLLERKDLDQPARIRHLYQLAYSRIASEGEVSRAVGYLDRIRAAMAESGIAGSEIEAKSWTSLCRAILSANEFVYVD